MQIDTEEIYRWIDTYQLSRQKKNINRDFSDAVPLAEILKQHFPKLVDIHNYAPKNSFSQKLVNWTTLQHKVLKRLKINLGKSSLEDLARGELGAIEKLLHQVKQVIEKNNVSAKEKLEDIYVVEGLEEAQDKIVPIKVKNGTKVTEQKIVPAEIFNKMVKDLEEKEDTIQTLTQKVEHLEKLVEVKESRIDDLCEEVRKLMVTSNRFLNDIF